MAPTTRVSVLLNNGDGTLAACCSTIPRASGPGSVAAADLNGDGKLDLVVANYGDDTVSVLLNNGNGTFGAKVDYPPGAGPGSVAAADLDGDGKPDLAVANLGDVNPPLPSPSSWTTVSVLIEPGQRHLRPQGRLIPRRARASRLGGGGGPERRRQARTSPSRIWRHPLSATPATP